MTLLRAYTSTFVIQKGEEDARRETESDRTGGQPIMRFKDAVYTRVAISSGFLYITGYYFTQAHHDI